MHCYADDIQLYVRCQVGDVVHATARLLACIAAIDKWMAVNKLKLNPEKTQFAWFGTWQQLRRFIMPSGIIISLVNVVHNLGCYIDSKLTLEDHVNAVVKSCMYQLRQLRTVHRSLTEEAAAHLVRAFVFSKLDYCNAILFGISDRLIHKLQLVQNLAARLVTYTRRFEHITPVLRDQLHWLPIKQRVIYKLALYVRRALRSELPSCLAELLVPLTGKGPGDRSAKFSVLWPKDMELTSH